MLLLFVDDNPSDFELARIALKGIPDLEFVHVEDFENFKKQYSPDKYGAIISDYNLSGKFGTDIFYYVNELEPDIPFIIISGALGDERAIDVLKIGITDYVLKDKLEKLPLALLRALKEAETKKEKHFAQKLLKENEEKYRLLIENMSEGLMYTDLEDTILFTNPRFNEMTGYSNSELNGKNAQELFLDSEEKKY